MTNCVKYIEDEKRKMFLLAKHLDARASILGRNLPPLILLSDKSPKFSPKIVSNQQLIRKNSKFLKFNQENDDNGDETVFESFLGGDENVYFTNNLRKKNFFLNNNLNNVLNEADIQSNENVKLVDCIQEFKSYYPEKYVHFTK